MKKLFFFISLLFSCFMAFAQEKPMFPGGDEALKKYLSENVKYPAASMDNGIEGTVLVGFMVASDGSINNIKIIKYVDPDLESEAIRVVSGMPLWVPAEKDGVKIEAPAVVNVPFLLE